MLIYFDSNGSLIRYVSRYALSDGTVSYNETRGNAGGVNTLFCHVDGLTSADITSAKITYELPDGTTFLPASIEYNGLVSLSINIDRTQDIAPFEYGTAYSFLKFTIPDGVLATSGTVKATVAYYTANSTYTLGIITFTVKDAVVVEETLITETQFNYLVSLIANKQNAWTVNQTSYITLWANVVGYGLQDAMEESGYDIGEQDDVKAFFYTVTENKANVATLRSDVDAMQDILFVDADGYISINYDKINTVS